MRALIHTFLFLFTSLVFVNAQNFSASHSGLGLTLEVNIDLATNVATIVITGPENEWFAYGFGGSIMDGTYAIITEQDDGNTQISERMMGDHNSGNQLVNSITSTETIVNSPMKTVMITLPASGVGANFDFPDQEEIISFIAASGFGGSLSFHGSENYIQGPSGLAFSSVVPVTWSYFEVGNRSGNAELSWQTENEVNNSGFYPQRSIDARNWTDLAFVEAKAKSGANYEFIDPETLPGINYYRLKQVDLDGTVSFSVIKSIEIRGNKTPSDISVFPNPARDLLTLEMEVSDEVKRIQIIDMNYKSVADEIWTGGTDKHSLNVSDFPPGHYMISVKHKDWSYSSHFVKM